jgi:hypothetical protein
MFTAILDTIKNIINPVTNMVDEITTSAEEKGKIKIELEKIKAEIQTLVLGLEEKRLDMEMKLMEYSNKLLMADATSDNTLQKTWRPIISLSLAGLVIIKYLVDVIYTFGWVDRQIVFDANFWLAVGGLWGITSLTRGVEKTSKSYKVTGTKK